MKKSLIYVAVVILVFSLQTSTYAATKKTTPTPTPKAMTQPKLVVTEVGKLKGTITWQYNDYVGTKPDVGAEVFLIPVKQKKNSLTVKDFVNVSDKKITAKSLGIYYAKANGYGNYEINSVPVGDYVIFISSLKTMRDILTPYNDEVATKLLKPYIKDWNDFIEGGISAFKSTVDTITITKNETIDFSFDFGNTSI